MGGAGASLPVALLIPFHDHGKPIGAVWIVSHTLDRKFDKEDERIVRVLSQLASAGWQLWKTSEAVADHSRRKDDFLATLGHELRNPLAASMTAASILQQRIAGDDRATRAIDVIARQSHHVSRLIDDLLDVARIGNGKLQLERRTVDLRTVVAETIETLRSQIERRRHLPTVEFCAEPILVEADPVRLARSRSCTNPARRLPAGSDWGWRSCVASRSCTAGPIRRRARVAPAWINVDCADTEVSEMKTL